MTDEYNLQRFVDAQEPDYADVLEELAAGEKWGHWMWYVFPQAIGLGHSAMSRLFAISSEAEAQTYADHPVLGPRLTECTTLVIDVVGRSITEILGQPDDLKFRSSMTLFQLVTGNVPFNKALDKYFAGEPDPLTVGIVQDWRRG